MIFSNRKHEVGSTSVNTRQKEHRNGVNWLNSAETCGSFKCLVRHVDRSEAIVIIIFLKHYYPHSTHSRSGISTL